MQIGMEDAVALTHRNVVECRSPRLVSVVVRGLHHLSVLLRLLGPPLQLVPAVSGAPAPRAGGRCLLRCLAFGELLGEITLLSQLLCPHLIELPQRLLDPVEGDALLLGVIGPRRRGIRLGTIICYHDRGHLATFSTSGKISRSPSVD